MLAISSTTCAAALGSGRPLKNDTNGGFPQLFHEVQKLDINSTTYATGLGLFSKMKYFLETLPPSFKIASNSRYKTLNYAIIKYLIDNPSG